MSKKILIGVGTRPEAIKLAPLILELRKANEFQVVVCSTGQHKELFDEVMNFFGISVDFNFCLMDKSKNILDLASQAISEMSNILDEIKPDLVLGQGDTTTAFVMAMSAYYKQIPFAHLEAGLRTNNLYSPWPEEGNRKMISSIASLHFAPTEESKKNLLNEGVSTDSIFVTGNTVIDALLYTIDKIDHGYNPLKFIDSENDRIVLITGHRRENLGLNFENIFGAVSDLTKSHPEVKFVFPMHPSPAVRMDVMSAFDNNRIPSNLFLIDPLGYRDFVWLMSKSTIIITDSGGIQEEAPALGKPVIVTRDTTERPEGVTAGTVLLVGSNRDKISRLTSELLEMGDLYESMSRAINPYGNGDASSQIVKILKSRV